MGKKKDDLIVRCMADMFIPLALVYGFSVILHGNLSPGGGFQGGVIGAVSVLLIYLGYGHKGLKDSFSPDCLHANEVLGSIAYIVFAVLGLYFGLNFCANVLAQSGNIGDLWSGGTVALMNYAVGYKVLTGVGLLLILIIGVLPADSQEAKGGDK